MSKPPSIGEVATISKLFFKYCPQSPATLVIAITLACGYFDTEANDSSENSIPSRIETLDQRSFAQCYLIRAEPDALLIRHSKGIARLAFTILDASLKEAFRYDPEEGFKAASEHYKKECYLQMLKFREEETVRAIRERVEKMETAKSSWIPAEATVIQANKKGIYVSAMRIVGNSASGKILKPFGPGCLFLPASNPGLRPGSLWKGYICPHPDDTVLDLSGEMFTVPFHQALTIGYQNTGGT